MSIRIAQYRYDYVHGLQVLVELRWLGELVDSWWSSIGSDAKQIGPFV